MIAGLLGSGALVLTLSLLILKAVAPVWSGSAGVERADGPRWWRIGVQFVAGLAAEFGRIPLRRWRPPARIAVGLVLVAGCLTALWLAWWQ